MAGGQPSTYTSEVGAVICERLSGGQSLLAICEEMGISEATARLWERDIPEHAANSARARELGCHALADQTLHIADNGRNDWMERNAQDDAGWVANGEHIQRSRLRIDTRMRLIGKWLPKVYGDNKSIDLNATVSHGEQVDKFFKNLSKP